MALAGPSDPTQDKGGEFITVVAPFIGLSTAAILLRIWARCVGKQQRRLWWDDWTAIIAYIEGIALAIVGILWTQYGLGRHMADVPPADSLMGLKLVWVSYFLFTTGAGVIKLSALLFYQRVFPVSKTFRTVLYAAHGLIGVWLIVFLCTIIFNCTPVDKFWEPQIAGHCIDLYKWYTASGVFDFILDIMVLVIPLPILWRLQLDWTRKVSIIAAFMCAYLAVIPSLGRLISTALAGPDFAADFTYSALTDLQWSYIEIPIGVISLCIPSWFYLFKRWYEFGFSSLFAFRNTRFASDFKSGASHASGIRSAKRESFRLKASGGNSRVESETGILKSSTYTVEYHRMEDV